MIIPVLAAVIRDHQNRVLIAKRKSGLTRGGYWEFPGGKLQSNESAEAGIRREIQEELAMAISVESLAAVVTHKYPDIEIVLIAYNCCCKTAPGAAKDHEEIRWVSIKDLHNYTFSDADKKLIAVL